MGNFKRCLDVTLTHEGGWADHPKDPGGATMNGVTLAVFRRWVPDASKTDLRNISDAMVEKVYRVDYWNPICGDDLPAGVDLAVFDFGVNSGVSRSSKYLQAIVGVSQDGVIGRGTLNAVAKRKPVDLVKAICAKRLGFVRGLSTFTTFGKGWTRRIADVEAKGVVMAGASRAELHEEADKAADLASQQNASAKVSGASGAAGSGGFFVGDIEPMAIAAIVILGVALFIFMKSRSNVNEARSHAYELAAISHRYRQTA